MMEGTLQVPPDRGTIIGRALWKSRYVVIGGLQREQQSDSSLSQGFASSMRGSAPRILTKGTPESIFLAIYKSKDEPDPVQQHAISSITDVQVQHVAHRKQGPVLPTLIVNISPDPATDKLRKRRSSRTAGLTSSKDTSPTTLWFRLPPNPEDQYTLHDWARCLQQLIQPNMPEWTPMSPISPASPTFVNPFSPIERPRGASDAHVRPGSGNAYFRGPVMEKNSYQTQSGRERDRPVTYSESPSLRSKRSDLSSQASSMKHPLQMAFPNYRSMHPADLPSPAATVEEYQGEFIEGWTSAQGRSSILSSPIRGRDSIGSQPPAAMFPSMDTNSPPVPRETILDRAFQMRYIPGSERGIPGEEKLSSLARFDALMREADERRKAREAEEAKAKTAAAVSASVAATQLTSPGSLKSGWDLDDDSDSEHDGRDDEDDDSDELALEADADDHFNIPSTSQRALDFIAARRTPHSFHQAHGALSQGVRPPPAYNHEALMSLSKSGSSNLRPKTGYSNKNRPGIAPRTHSQPQLANSATVVSAMINAAPGTLLDIPGPSAANRPLGEESAVTPTNLAAANSSMNGASQTAALHRSATERHSTSSTKRLSFTDFTRRLSCTSSLLLVQTNTSAASSRGSSEADSQLTQSQPPLSSQPRGHQQSRGMPPAPNASDRDREAWEKRCGWRGSVGVFGAAEGGFL